MSAIQKPKPVSPDRSTGNRSKVNPYSFDDTASSDRDWSIMEANAGDLQLLIAAAVANGDAIMFSASKKGPLVGITIYHDGEPAKKWATNPEQFAELVEKFTRLALQQLPAAVVEKLTT